MAKLILSKTGFEVEPHDFNLNEDIESPDRGAYETDEGDIIVNRSRYTNDIYVNHRRGHVKLTGGFRLNKRETLQLIQDLIIRIAELDAIREGVATEDEIKTT